MTEEQETFLQGILIGIIIGTSAGLLTAIF